MPSVNMCDDIMESAILNSSAGGVQDALDMGIGNGTGLSSSPFSNLTTTVDVTDIGSNGSFEDHEALLLVHLTSAASGYHIVTGALLIICAVIAIIGKYTVLSLCGNAMDGAVSKIITLIDDFLGAALNQEERKWKLLCDKNHARFKPIAKGLADVSMV